MAVTRARFVRIVRHLGIGSIIAAALNANIPSAHAVVKIFDGFGDADRNNNGVIDTYDAGINNNATLDDPVGDAALIARGIHEVTAAQDPSDVGIVWSGMRSYDTAAQIPKSRVRIINDSVATGSETAADIFNHGLALGVESAGGGSSFMGRFAQPIDVGPIAGDKVVVSVNFRTWDEAGNQFTAPAFNRIRWGLFEDTDNELGSTGPRGLGGATVTWGTEDGNWFASAPGAEGDKGIHVEYEFGDPASAASAARIRWEYNVAGINGTNPTTSGSNGRILEGTGVSDTPGVGGDVATIASPPNDGLGGIFGYTPANLKIEIVRLADGLVEVATFIDGAEILRDEIKTTDTGYNVLQPPPFSYDYVAFRNEADFDYAIDDFKVEVIGSNAGLAGDYNNDGSVNAADYVLWRKGVGTLANEVADVGTFSAADYTEWRARFGNPSGSGASLGGGAVPEPGSVWMLLIGAIAVNGNSRRRSA